MEEFHEEYIEGNLQVIPSYTLDEAYFAFRELATEFPTTVDEETQQEILVDAIIEAFDRDFESDVCLAWVDMNPIAEEWKRRIYVMLMRK